MKWLNLSDFDLDKIKCKRIKIELSKLVGNNISYIIEDGIVKITCSCQKPVLKFPETVEELKSAKHKHFNVQLHLDPNIFKTWTKHITKTHPTFSNTVSISRLKLSIHVLSSMPRSCLSHA